MGEVSKLNFCPIAAQAARRTPGLFRWLDIDGTPSHYPVPNAPSPDDVIAGRVTPNMQSLRFRDPNLFVAGTLNNDLNVWDDVLSESSNREEVRGWLHHGVNLFDFFQPFKGESGRYFSSAFPSEMYFLNAPICQEYVHFINDTITKRLKEGSVSVLGRIHEVSAPRCVNALTVEPQSRV